MGIDTEQESVYNVSTALTQRGDMSPEERLTLRIDPELKRTAQAKAKAEDLTLSQVVRRFLRAWVGEDEQPKEEKTDQD
jgi:antitoxin component of RelBE/YafQ-DinJ toxin-antitoxin module